jgi:hypothetical protein
MRNPAAARSSLGTLADGGTTNDSPLAARRNSLLSATTPIPAQ